MPSIRPARATVWLVFAVALLAGFAHGEPAEAGSVFLSGIAMGGGAVNVHVESLQHRKFTRTVHQEYDFSCGSAALATLLSYNYGDRVSEQVVFRSMFAHGNKPVIERYGFSLLDMKRYLARHGLPSGGFRTSLNKIRTIGVPGIALINVRGYHHFVVIEGIDAQSVLLSDPSVGVHAVPIATFQRQWSRVFFAILTDAIRARSGFNRAGQWAIAPRAPFGLTRYAVDFATLQQPALLNANRF